MTNPAHIPRPALLASLALLSALLSNYVQLTDQAIAFNVPILPGLYFGIVIALATYAWAEKGAFRTIMVFVLTVVAWMLACRATMYIYGTIDDEIHSMMVPQISDSTIVRRWPITPDYLLGLCGLVGGLVGSSITAFAVSMVAKQFRTMAHLTRTILIGTLLGFLLEMYLPNNTPTALSLFHIESTLPLFVCWQMAVAASIAYGLNNK